MTEPHDSVPPPADPTDAMERCLRAAFGAPEVGARDAAEPVADAASHALWGRLHARRHPHERYELRDEIARGGMGVILEAWDPDLRRGVAMKRILHRAPMSAAQAGSQSAARFLEEAQVTGQLDHPGVVPVHELGTDEAGQAYFTMRLVRGKTLSEIFEMARAGREGWSLTRVLEVLVKVCDTMAYAHSKQVIHRDLKPANIMVGRFGEVYVMDWGIARVLSRGEHRDLRIAAEDAEHAENDERSTLGTLVVTHRHDAREATPHSPLFTMDGFAVGTPSFMSPEQAHGKIDQMDARSDVYAIGAMLYQLFSGAPPYLAEEASAATPRRLLLAVMQRSPRSLAAIDRRIAPELISICEKAMAREREERYADAEVLASELRAYLENRVVRAHRTGALHELRKWVQRNRALAASIAAAMMVIVILTVMFTQQVAAERDQARENLRDVLDLSASQRLIALQEEANTLLWPPHVDRIPAMEAWLERARALQPLLNKLAEKLAHLEAAALTAPVKENTAEHATELATDSSPPRTWSFAASDGQSAEDLLWRHDLLAGLVERLQAFCREAEVPPRAYGIYEGTRADVERRRDLARTWHQQSLEASEAHEAWREAIAYAAREDGPYAFPMSPMEGFVPLLPPNPRTQLLEFWHVPSGSKPELNPAWSESAHDVPYGQPIANPNRWILSAESGMVFVLVPGGRFVMGSQKHDLNGANFDELAEADEVPLTTVELDPYLLSKYEMTQAQWFRLRGRNPSYHDWTAGRVSPTAPVEQITWIEAAEMMSRLGLALPTEAQWEYACRGASAAYTRWFCGNDAHQLIGSANLPDESYRDAGGETSETVGWSDGFVVTSPVGSFRPNDFGLHDLHGNVWEWCRDWKDSYAIPPRRGDGLRITQNREDRVYRGGSFGCPVEYARTSLRFNVLPTNRAFDLGLRPARNLGP